MQAKLSAIGLGALLACACGGALAQITATTTQQGIGNTAYTEQISTTDFGISATIEQIGNNNRAGDPVTKTPGIFQRPVTGAARLEAAIRQRGDENTASIVQERNIFPDVTALIEQVGNNNTAAITQDVAQGVNASLNQNGHHNVARVQQLSFGDRGGARGIQNGSENFLSITQENNTLSSGVGIQNGFRNSGTIYLSGFESFGNVEQDGSMNTATITIRDVEDTTSSVRQLGTGNTATTTQLTTFFGSSSDVFQDGNNNLATVRQAFGANDALIAQIGDNNSATVMQTGAPSPSDRNSAYIRQVGDGLVASITQSGAGNQAGIYQH
jgi:hypothetical protein